MAVFLMAAVFLCVFVLGLCGVFFARKSVIIMLLSIELMLLAVNVLLLLFSVLLDDVVGQVFALLVLTVAAAESSIGLALLVVYFRARGSIALEYMNALKG